MVTGATGKVGGAVISLLAADPSIELVAAVRSPAKLRDRGIAVVRLDYDRIETLAQALTGVDRVLMLTGYTVDMFAQSKAFINEAKRVGVQFIVHLGACGDDDTKVAHWGWQQFVERYIEWAGFSSTHLRPDIFMQNLLGYGGARVVVDGVVRHYVGGARISWVDCDDVAAVAAACLRHPELHAGKTYRLPSDAKSFDEIAEILSRTIGLPFSYEPRPPEEFLELVLAAGADPAYMRSAYENYAAYTAGTVPEPGADFATMAAIIRRKGVTWKEFALKHAGQLRYRWSKPAP
ncbi:Uncharacterized conserved protein YbjT, contains NAD(P)-binding and DUF2867 domains [Rhizobiales bacterium GAS113]|nr:Uncharacterized conserved protein YbjT, contains NAD(P)-binding and DUF2867 domains [Rhizobiales bacterium GAS113]